MPLIASHLLRMFARENGPAKRLERWCATNASIASTYGLRFDEFDHVLADCDQPTENLGDSRFTAQMDQTGFWRVDKDKPPELRHTVLTLVAFHDLQQKTDAAGGDRDAGRGGLFD